MSVLKEVPWTKQELVGLLDSASRLLRMSRSEVADSYRRGTLPDTPAAFDAATALQMLNGFGGNQF